MKTGYLKMLRPVMQLLKWVSQSLLSPGAHPGPLGVRDMMSVQHVLLQIAILA